MGTLAATQDAIAGLLPACGADSIQRVGQSCWRLAFSNGEIRAALAATDGDWLTLEVRPPVASRRSSSPQSLWDCLGKNHWLPGGIKFVLRPQDRSPRIRAELPLEAGICTAEAVCAAGQGLRAAFHYLGEAEELRPSSVAARDAEVQTTGCDLEDLCTSIGWDFARRASGHLAIRLESRGGACHAILAHHGQGASATVCLAACKALGPKPRHALAILLLAADGLVRMIRSTAAQEEGRTALGYEVVMESCPTAEQLDRVLSALSVACGLCGPREIATMQDEYIADRYLAIRGWAS
jgi:hypothetical protein